MGSKPGLPGVLALSFLLAACGITTNPELTEPAEQFFDAIASDDNERAHRFLANSLSARTSAQQLRNFVAQTGLGRPGDRSWQASRIDGEHAHLTGEIEVNGGADSIPVRLNFTKQGVQWKIAGLERGIRIDSPDGQILVYAPSESDSTRMAQQTTANFAAAIAQGDLSTFWSGMADVFRARFSLQDFTVAFGSFVQDRVNLAPAAKLQPAFNGPPTVNPDGELVMQGVFPSKPSQVAFEYRYVMQNGKWTTSGLTLDLVPRGR